MVDRMGNLGETVPIALVGKYVDYRDSYLSVKEALKHAGLAHGRDIDIQWIHSEDVEKMGADALLSTACGIVVPGGFGPRGVEGMVETVHYARQHQVPYLGLCLGLQVMVIDWARDVLGLKGANSSELDPDAEHPVVHIMEEQRGITTKGGTMRLGDYPCLPQEDTWTMAAYQTSLVNERHRHRFEYKQRLQGGHEQLRVPSSVESLPTARWWKAARFGTTHLWLASSSTQSFSRAQTGQTLCLLSSLAWPRKTIREGVPAAVASGLPEQWDVMETDTVRLESNHCLFDLGDACWLMRF